MKKSIVLSALLLICAAGISFAGIKASTDDGIRIILNENGTWQYDGIIAKTEKGETVILYNDGTWRYFNPSKPVDADKIQTAPVVPAQGKVEQDTEPVEIPAETTVISNAKADIDSFFTPGIEPSSDKNIVYGNPAQYASVWNSELKHFEADPKLNRYNPEIRLFLNYQNNDKKDIRSISVKCIIKNSNNEILYSDTFREEVFLKPGVKFVNSAYREIRDNPSADDAYDRLKAPVAENRAVIETEITGLVYSDGSILLADRK